MTIRTLTLETDQDRQVLIDALAEFIKTRTPVTEYVSKRYSEHEDAFVMLKKQTVDARVTTAGALLRMVRDT